MDQVFILRGAGFGDDEDSFENISAHTTFAGAEAKRDALMADTGLSEDNFDIAEMQLET